MKADPSIVSFGLVVEGSGPQERRVKLTPEEDLPVQLALPPESPGRRLKYELVTKTPGKEYELVVRLLPPYEPGPLNESVNLSTGDSRQKVVNIRSNGSIVARLAVEPAALQMSQGPEGQAFGGSVHLKNRGTAPVNITGTQTDAPEVRVTVKEISPGHDFEVRVEAPADFTPPPAGLPILIRTDDPARPSFTFPLMPRPKPRRAPANLIGKPAPAFSFKTLGGKEVSNATAASEVTLLDFFAADCPHCKRQVPAVAKVVREFAGKPVRLVIVAQKLRGTFTVDQVRDVLKASGVDPDSVELAVDMTNTVGSSFFATSYPALVYLGKDGKVAAADLGTPADLEVRVRGNVGALLAGKAILPPAAAAPAGPAHRSAPVVRGTPQVPESKSDPNSLPK